MHFRSKKKLSSEISLNDVIDVDRDGNLLTYLDVVSSDESLEDDVSKQIISDKALKVIDRVLTPREKRIIVLRFGLNGKKPMTQKGIADALGISRSYVSRIEKSAIEKVRDALR